MRWIAPAMAWADGPLLRPTSSPSTSGSRSHSPRDLSPPRFAAEGRAAKRLAQRGCRPTYQPQAYSDRKTIRRTFRSLADARAWRAETQTALHRGSLRGPSRTTLSEAAEEWLRAAEAGVVRTRSGDPYKPSALRTYEQPCAGSCCPSSAT
jgi:hypothetical protein